MDKEKIIALRNRIAIPLTKAKELLSQSKGDVLAAEQIFHAQNIAIISNKTDCDTNIAQENYLLCGYDLAKAIAKINKLPIIITTQTTPIPSNEIGFILYPKTIDGERYPSVKRDDIFIPRSDFEIIIHAFEAVFPLAYPSGNEVQKKFDICSHNFFGINDCQEIIRNIRQIKTTKAKIQPFLKKVVDWLQITLNYADIIVVYGNQ